MKFRFERKWVLLVFPAIVAAGLFVFFTETFTQPVNFGLLAFITCYCYAGYFVYQHCLGYTTTFFYRIPMAINWLWILIAVNLLAVLTITYLFICNSYQRYQAMLTEGESLYQLACVVDNERMVAAQRFNNQLIIQTHLGQLVSNRFARFQRYFVSGGNTEAVKLQQKLWYCYISLNERNLIQPLSAKLQQQLAIYIRPGVSLTNRMQMFASSYEQLTAYKMMAEPQKINFDFLVTILTDDRLRPDTIPVEQWHAQSVDLISFYVANLAYHPDWAIRLNNLLVADVRRSLIHDINLHNSESAIYQRILRQATQNYDDLSLRRLLDGVDSQMLFVAASEVPGLFTRQAWEGVIENEINQHVINAYPDIQWVIGEQGMQQLLLLPQDQLRMTLIYRYTRDYDAAWYYFLNNLSWRKAESVDESVDQLALLSDPIKSPFVALINAITEQGKISYSTDALATEPESNGNASITHNKLYAFTESSRLGYLIQRFNSQSASHFNQQAYLDFVTLSLRQLRGMTHSADPVKVANEMSKTIYRDDNNELLDSFDYSHRLAIALGPDWSNFGINLVVQPVEQAWLSLLDPLVERINQRWQMTIADLWNGNLVFYYPFRKSNKDVPLNELYQLLRPGSGSIEQFLSSELAAILEQHNGRWLAPAMKTDRLRLHPKLLQAINQVSLISGSMPADDDIGLSFELTGLINKDVTRTELIIDEQTAIGNKSKTPYLIVWPTDNRFAQVELTWTTDFGGERRYEDIRGTLAFVRLLEKAKVKSLDNRRYLVSWKASDGNLIEFELKAKRGRGPLAFLLLRGLSMPPFVFEQIKK